MASRAPRAFPSVWSPLFLAVVGVATVGYFFLAAGSQSILNSVVAMTAGALALASASWQRAEPRYAWTLFGLGVLMWAGGDILFGISAPVPSPADMLYISGYPLVALGLIGIGQRVAPGRRLSSVIETAIIVAGVAITAIFFLIVPTQQAQGVGYVTEAVSAGYPLMDLGLLAVLVRAARLDTARRVPFTLMGAGLLLTFAADTGYMLLDFGTAYVIGGPADAAWLFSYACFGAAALHPSLAQTRSPAPLPSPAPPSSPGSARRPESKKAMIARAQALRFRVVLAWAGVLLLILGVASLVLATTWHAPNLVLLAGAYAGPGALISFSSLITS